VTRRRGLALHLTLPFVRRSKTLGASRSTSSDMVIR
jgi:hypothetical protein